MRRKPKSREDKLKIAFLEAAEKIAKDEAARGRPLEVKEIEDIYVSAYVSVRVLEVAKNMIDCINISDKEDLSSRMLALLSKWSESWTNEDPTSLTAVPLLTPQAVNIASSSSSSSSSSAASISADPSVERDKRDRTFPG